jgi:hypothetical protein
MEISTREETTTKRKEGNTMKDGEAKLVSSWGLQTGHIGVHAAAGCLIGQTT